MTLQSEVIDTGLCTGCGTCAGICPTGAIIMKPTCGLFEPTVNAALCTQCQLCLKACPGRSVDFEALRMQVFGAQPAHKTIGNYSSCYTAYSFDQDIRFHSASGGAITQLLLFALENKIIDGAVVTRMSKTNPLQPEAFIAKTKQEIIDASKSKYCPVSTNACLKQILKEEGKFAIVGLPCHIHGVRKAETLLKVLQGKIVLQFGLLCSHTVDFAGIDFLLQKLGVEPNQVSKMSYRGEGWPGSLTVETKTANKITMPLVGSWHAYWPLFSSFFFTPLRCTMCSDQAAEFSDLSFGDAWLPEYRKEKTGASIIVSRTQRGQQLLNAAASAKVLNLKPLDVSRVEQSQHVNLRFKKDDLACRLSFLASMGQVTPSYPNLACSSGSISALRTLYVYSNLKAASNMRLRSVLRYVPFPVIRAYYGIYKSLCRIY